MKTVMLEGLGRCRKEEGPTFLAYFCLEPNAAIDRSTVDLLKNMTRENPGKSVRICLHPSPDAPFHNMLIAVRRGVYIRPHRHRSKDETFQIVDGEMAVVVFSDSGDIARTHRMSAANGILLRIESGRFHTMLPLSEIVVFHESTTGPYDPGDRVFAPWAPDGLDRKQAESFVESIGRIITNSE